MKARIWLSRNPNCNTRESNRYTGWHIVHYGQVHLQQPETRRLIWAYDEYQNINTLEIPSAKTIFGEEKGLDKLFLGSYKGNMPKSIIMRESYRTPGPVILAAHALCMGMLNREGMIAGPTQKAECELLGYQVTGTFQKNSMITLERPSKNSKNPLTHFQGMPPLFSFDFFVTEDEAYQKLAKTIYNLIKVDGILPKNRILVVHLSKRYKIELFTKYLMDKGISFYFPGESDINIDHTSNYRDKRPRDFWKDGAVTIASVNQAKGNEADFVFVIGLEDIAADPLNVQARNALFVAMTRTKGWVSTVGHGRPGRSILPGNSSDVENASRKIPSRLRFNTGENPNTPSMWNWTKTRPGSI